MIRFGKFEMDTEALELKRDGQRLRLQIQPFRVLQILVENAGNAVSRDELRRQVWPSNVFLDFDHGLNNAVARLREALGDSSDRPRYIETLPRVGYRFIYPLDAAPAAALAPARPDPTTRTWNFRLFAGLTSLTSNLWLSHFSAIGPSGIRESSDPIIRPPPW